MASILCVSGILVCANICDFAPICVSCAFSLALLLLVCCCCPILAPLLISYYFILLSFLRYLFIFQGETARYRSRKKWKRGEPMGIEGGETVIKIHCIKKYISNLKNKMWNNLYGTYGTTYDSAYAHTQSTCVYV